MFGRGELPRKNKINSFGSLKTPFCWHKLAFWGRLESLKWLLENGCPWNDRDSIPGAPKHVQKWAMGMDGHHGMDLHLNRKSRLNLFLMCLPSHYPNLFIYVVGVEKKNTITKWRKASRTNPFETPSFSKNDVLCSVVRLTQEDKGIQRPQERPQVSFLEPRGTISRSFNGS